ncbi:antitoxin MazE [Azotobacter beijerinckii]|uniref:Antitoxin MazE n=1 Tax=Azotobacter beijerinckii TaxID=170623 RepID=A0A1H9SGS5_9GAMM|nr:AbrB/MazE/SpoVT family DNA-binding domain-containing protein [Azotobacter beijerinckii]SER84240.1 antitoxin MazE [Azotobacter beijerinckii]
MITQIRKVGNSAGVLIPSALLKEVKLTVGAEIDLTVENGVLNIKPVKAKRQGSREVSLNWLLADFQDVEGELIPGAVGAEVMEDDEHDHRACS